jgi:uncharacterized membrane protein HdeD (DUF308 family)
VIFGGITIVDFNRLRRSTPDAAVAIAAGIFLDVVANAIDARSQRESARWLLLANSAVSIVAAAGLAVAATESIADVLAVFFGVWAGVAGAAQLGVALRRRPQYGNQWPLLLAGSLCVVAGFAYVIASTGSDPSLTPLVVDTATGGIEFVVQAWLLARRRHRLVAVPA